MKSLTQLWRVGLCAVAVALAVAGGAFAGGRQDQQSQDQRPDPAAARAHDGQGWQIPPAPTPVPAADLPLSDQSEAAIELVFEQLADGRFPLGGVRQVGASGDLRLLWFLSDVAWLFGTSGRTAVATAAANLLGDAYSHPRGTQLRDWLLAWDFPAPPGYTDSKRRLFTLIEPRWDPFFADADALIDWRWVGWGGVFIDDRIDTKGSERCPRGCIPALDELAVTDAAGGSW